MSEISLKFHQHHLAFKKVRQGCFKVPKLEKSTGNTYVERVLRPAEDSCFQYNPRILTDDDSTRFSDSLQ